MGLEKYLDQCDRLPGFHRLEDSRASWNQGLDSAVSYEVVRFTTSILQQYHGGDIEFHLGGPCHVYVSLSSVSGVLLVVEDSVQEVQFVKQPEGPVVDDIRELAACDLMTELSREFWSGSVADIRGQGYVTNHTPAITHKGWEVRLSNPEELEWSQGNSPKKLPQILEIS